ncbi:hypothetical protein NDU88_006306 [Pleurodeles waltl]|uniref:Uncharacterized protein n=1 Tax=Pleurodeles waltl TaxID=8319 RepID=A0AAV7LS60_PLEWA|nr:hypothetical protein NDU88_006306 [Pleurodeles waltl]
MSRHACASSAIERGLRPQEQHAEKFRNPHSRSSTGPAQGIGDPSDRDVMKGMANREKPYFILARYA